MACEAVAVFAAVQKLFVAESVKTYGPARSELSPDPDPAGLTDVNISNDGLPPGPVRITSTSPTQVWAGPNVMLTATSVGAPVKPLTLNVTWRPAPPQSLSGMAPSVHAFAGKTACGEAIAALARVSPNPVPYTKTATPNAKTTAEYRNVLLEINLIQSMRKFSLL